METALLVGVLAFLGIMFYVGYKKGIIKILLSFVATIAAFLLAALLAGPIETYIKNNTSIYTSLKDKMSLYIILDMEDEIDLSTVASQKDAIKKLELPSALQDKLISENISVNNLDMSVDNFNEVLSESMADIIIHMATITVLFIIIKLILRVLISVLNIVGRIPLIKELNMSLGGVLGIVEGVLIIWVACLTLTAFSGTHAGEQILNAISSNSILNFIYSNNIIMKILL